MKHKTNEIKIHCTKKTLFSDSWPFIVSIQAHVMETKTKPMVNTIYLRTTKTTWRLEHTQI